MIAAHREISGADDEGRRVTVLGFIDLPCSQCGATPGQRCRTVTTGKTTGTHRARRDDYAAGMVAIPSRWHDSEPVAWLTFAKAHPRSEVCDQGCVIHNRTPHHMQHWRLIWRDDRQIFERMCPDDGCCHPDPDQGPYWRATGQDWQWIHGCVIHDDGRGCCADRGNL